MGCALPARSRARGIGIYGKPMADALMLALKEQNAIGDLLTPIPSYCPSR